MNYKVPVIAGDGIGPEIIAEGKKVLEAAADKYNFAIEWRGYSLGAEHYLKTGELVSEETLKDLSHYPFLQSLEVIGIGFTIAPDDEHIEPRANGLHVTRLDATARNVKILMFL